MKKKAPSRTARRDPNRYPKDGIDSACRSLSTIMILINAGYVILMEPGGD